MLTRGDSSDACLHLRIPRSRRLSHSQMPPRPLPAPRRTEPRDPCHTMYIQTRDSTRGSEGQSEGHLKAAEDWKASEVQESEGHLKAIEVKDHQREYRRKELQQRTQRATSGAEDVTETDPGHLPSLSGLPSAPSLLPRRLPPSTHTSPASAGLAGGVAMCACHVRSMCCAVVAMCPACALLYSSPLARLQLCL